MRLAIFNWRDLDHPRAGGSEVYVQQLARWWAAWGHQVTLVCAAVPGCAADGWLDGYRIIRRGGRLGVYRAARQVYEDTIRGRVDVVVDVVNTRPFLTPRYVREPVVALIHQVAADVWAYEAPPLVAGLGRHVLEPRWLRTYARLPVLTVSPSSRDSLAAYGLEDVTVVPEGVDPPHGHRPAKQVRPTLLFVGRLSANKRPDHAVEAYRRVAARWPEAQLWVVGDGPLARRLRRSAPSGVTFFGRVDSAKRDELMGAAHVLVATSVREGWGLTVSEAALRGTRAVAYDVPGLRDSVPPAGGVLTAPCVGDLADTILDVLPRWQAEGATDLGDVGVRPWSDVAAAVLEAVSSAADAPGRPTWVPAS